MNSWSRARKRIILIITLLVLGVLLGVPIFFFFNRTPTCTDNKLNGDETGIDCGGSCQKLCAPESFPLIIEGDPRVLTIATSTYEVVALLENPNQNAEISRARYIVRLYNSSSLVPLKSIEGEAYIPPGARLALFEGPFLLEEELVPTRAILEWDEATLVWEKTARVTPELTVKTTNISRLNSAPRLEAVIGNPDLGRVYNVDLTAILYDESGNIFAAAKTFISEIPSVGESPAVFTWPTPLVGQPVEVEVLTRVYPDPSYLR
jgi:hypothetical protein